MVEKFIEMKHLRF